MKYGSYEWGIYKKHISCSSGMALWTSLQEMSIEVVTQRKLTKQEIKDSIKSFPNETHNCKCRNCRYFRIFCKGK